MAMLVTGFLWLNGAKKKTNTSISTEDGHSGCDWNVWNSFYNNENNFSILDNNHQSLNCVVNICTHIPLYTSIKRCIILKTYLKTCLKTYRISLLSNSKSIRVSNSGNISSVSTSMVSSILVQLNYTWKWKFTLLIQNKFEGILNNSVYTCLTVFVTCTLSTECFQKMLAN